MALNFSTPFLDSRGIVTPSWQRSLSELNDNTWTAPDSNWALAVLALAPMTATLVSTPSYVWHSHTAHEARFSLFAGITLAGSASTAIFIVAPFAGVDGISQHCNAHVYTANNWKSAFAYVANNTIVIENDGEVPFPLGGMSVMVSGTYLRK